MSTQQVAGHAGDAADARHNEPAAAPAQVEDLKGLSAAEIFTRRILPIVQADQSSSCTECHFAGVELRDFVAGDQAATFASLKASGMIDVAKPDESKLLRFIGRKPEKPNELLAKVREQELAAFREWIRAAVRDPELLKASPTVELGTKLPPEVIRHARRDRVLSLFLDNVWSEAGRCINCHSPELNRNKIGRNGLTRDDVDAISWIVPRDPAGTLAKLVEGGNIDFDNPQDSSVLTKPAGLSDHGGGPKFFPGSQTYRNILAFLTDFAAINNGTYQSSDDLPEPPAEVTLLSEQQLRLTDIPAAFSDRALQIDLYRRESNGEWSAERWATGFSRVNGKQNVWQNPIQVTAPAKSPRADELRKRPLLAPGTYLIKLRVDRDQKTAADPTFALGDAELVGQVEITGDWPPGYQPPRIVKFPASRN